MPRKKRPEPRVFLAHNGFYPYGPFVVDTPDDVLAAACFASNLLTHMKGDFREVDGDVILGQKESQLSLAAKAGVDQGVLSRVLSGRSYPDISTIASLETFLRGRLWCGPKERAEHHFGGI